ncbi:MAG: N-acetylneuraminate synthase family protein, partial [Muribaculaceae bacterium]|nr:N-acetylneuraminate synthase family protein [Muribaculaceae bacterium]
MITPHTIIIAEAGVNHNGSLEMALELVDKAADAGADYVKFQTFKAEKLVSRNAQKAKYQQENTTDKDNTQLAMLKRLELSISEHLILIARCKERGISFLSTAFDMESIDFLHSLGLPLWKIPSGEITNLPYLRRIAGYGGKVIMSTGMSDINDVSNAVEVLVSGGVNKSDIVLLHCNTQYPTPMSDVNL